MEPSEQDDLKWAKNAIMKGRQHFLKKPSKERFAITNPALANKTEESVARNLKETKRQRSGEEAKPVAKRRRSNAASANSTKQPSSAKKIAKVSDVGKRCLFVALIDRRHQWKQVEEKLLQAIGAWIVNVPDKHSPSHEGAGWFLVK